MLGGGWVRALKNIARFLCSALALIVMHAAISPVQAQGETVEFANPTPLDISAADPCCAVTTASPYPSSIEIPGMDGLMTDVSVTLHGLSFNRLEDLAVLLTGPNGKSVVLMASYYRVPPGGRPYAVSASGHQSAVSAGVVIALRSLTEVSSSASVSAAEVAAMLNGWLTRSGNMARIATLLKSGAFSMSLHAITAGTAVIDWYQDDVSARGGSIRRRQTLVATGKLTFTAPGTANLEIKLTAKGKRLLRKAKRPRLTAKGTFAAVGMTPITSTRTFFVKR
jgi:hypothetical protein